MRKGQYQERTPVLLAFGTHGENIYGKSNVTPFFQDNVCRFIDEKIVGEDRQGAVIHEYILLNMISSGPKGSTRKSRKIAKLKGHKQIQIGEKIREETKELYEHITSLLRSYRDKGIGITNLDVQHDFGFLERILCLNHKRNGRVQSYLEPQDERTTFDLCEWDLSWRKLSWRIKLMHLGIISLEKQLPYFAEEAKHLIKMHLRRDTNVYELAKGIRSQDPKRAIIIPRGLGHKGMKALFDPNEFDISFVAEDGPSDFSHDLLEKSYSGQPTEEEFQRNIRLQAEYHKRLINLRLADGSQTYLTDIGRKRINLAARNYALEQLAAERGLKANNLIKEYQYGNKNSS